MRLITDEGGDLSSHHMTYTIMTETVDPAVAQEFSVNQILVQLDSFELTPNQFRVYSHLLLSQKQARVHKGSESIAKVCKLTRITVIRVLAQLVDMGMLQCDRTPGKKSVFYLLPISSWRMASNRQDKQTTEQLAKVVQLKVSNCKPSLDTCKPDIQVNLINTQEQESTGTPYRGVPVDSPATELHSESNQLNSDTGKVTTSLSDEPVFTDEYDKREALSKLGIKAGISWVNNLPVVVVDHVCMSVEEFMKRSLDSFTSRSEQCSEGRAIIAAVINRFKQKKKACAI